MTFRTWLDKHLNKIGPLGDLARELALDGARDFRSLRDLLNYLTRHDASNQVLTAAKHAWQIYEEQWK